MYNHSTSEPSQVWDKFLTTLSIGTTITSKEIEIKSCFEHLFRVLSLHAKLGSPAFMALQKIRDKNICSRSLVKNGDRLNENLVGAWGLFS